MESHRAKPSSLIEKHPCEAFMASANTGGNSVDTNIWLYIFV